MTHDVPSKKLESPLTHARVDGMEMGILADGTPYLTPRALARIAGQTPSVIYKLTRNWHLERERPRGQRIAELLDAQDYDGDGLYLDIAVAGKPTQVVPDAVCMAILEYYAFECEHKRRPVALNSYRVLARQSLRHYIYNRVGYDPSDQQARAWQLLHDRMALNPSPQGYFNLLREIAEILIPAIQLGLVMGPHTMPDISVGLAWGRYWQERGLDRIHGPRVKHTHRFPAEFHRPDTDAWAYPNAALGEFRSWMHSHYMPTWLPRYLQGKATSGHLPPYQLDLLVDAVNGNVMASD